MLIELDQLEESQQAHDLLTGAIVPRPIAWVSTVNPAGEHNLAPFSFFTGVAWRPATIAVSIVNRKDGSEKDTLRNIRQTKEFVVNSVSVEQGPLMFRTAQTLPYGTDEAGICHVEMVPAELVGCRRVKDAKVAFECRLLDVVTVGSGSFAGNLVLGSVLALHVDERILRDGPEISWSGLNSLGRVGGANRFCAVESVIEMELEK
ncbi:MAG TPA: flavin reductase family protein [Sedimentisphaerales bacterium]|nr:flavin reductase family protein [Sedimentisphaerales bacterium]